MLIRASNTFVKNLNVTFSLFFCFPFHVIFTLRLGLLLTCLVIDCDMRLLYQCSIVYLLKHKILAVKLFTTSRVENRITDIVLKEA